MALMVDTSKFGSSFALSSMAMVVPITNGDGATVMLNAAIFLCIAAFNPSSSSLYIFLRSGMIAYKNPRPSILSYGGVRLEEVEGK